MESAMQTIQAKFLLFDFSTSTFVQRSALVLSATLLIAICAHIAVPLPISPVPITLQTFAVLLTALVLGPRLGCITLCAYLLEGAAGLPVFNPHGLGGVAQLLGPTGGYLFSYPLAALIAGWGANFLRKYMPSFSAAVFSCLAASLCIFSLGASWLHALLHLSSQALWMTAVVPFMSGEVLKIGAAASLYSAWQHWRTR
jgi:biotin transport system substrate-specific component